MKTLELEALDLSLSSHGFERFEAIGHGLGSTVFRCHHIESGKDMALKWWSAESLNPARESALSYYLQNLKSRAQDRTPPNSVPVHAVARKRRYLIMNLMKANVAAHQSGAAIDPDKAAELLRQSLECLHRLHSRRAIHGALKPANVLVDHRNQFALSDIRYLPVNANGLVEDTQWLPLHTPQPTGADVRQPGFGSNAAHAKYLAPESINPEFGPRGTWIDQFMAGFLAFELIVGQERFDRLFPGVGTEAMDVELGWLRWHGSRERTPSPYDVLPDLDSGLKNVLHRMTRKEVDKRFSDVRAALQALLKDAATTHIMPGLGCDEPAKAVAGVDHYLSGPTTSREADDRPLKRNAFEVSSSQPFRKAALLKTDAVGSLGGAVNPFADLEPEKYSREWWEEKLAEPRMARRVKLAGASMALLLLLGLAGSGTTKSRIVFTSTTPGIEVRVNGEQVELNRELDFTVGKEIAIEAAAGNFEPLTGRMERIEPSKTPRVLPIELKPQLCHVRVDPGMPAATVTLDGERYPGNASDFPVGKQLVIEWTAPGYEKETRSIVIPANAGKKLRFASFVKRPKPRPVIVATTPPGATVRMVPEGTIQGKSGETFEMQIGTHALRLELEGYEPLDLGPVELQPGEGPHRLGSFTLKPLLRRATLEVTSDPADAQVKFVAVDEAGQEIPGVVPGSGGEVPVGSTWKVVATHAGRSQTKQIKIAEGPNRLNFELSIVARIRNKVGMEFVYVPPPESDFEFGNRITRQEKSGTITNSKPEGALHGQLREVARGPWSPPALVMHRESIKVPYRPAFQVPPVKVRVSLGVYVCVDEVTVQDWRRVMGERPRFMKEDAPDDQPVAGVLRKEAQAFLNQLARVEGLPPGTYRLMSDAEFDYLAKHGEAGIEHATLAETHGKKPGAAGLNKADKFGLRELHGNMAELVEDYFIRGYQDHFRNRLDPVQHRPTDVGIARGCHFGIPSAKFSPDFRMFVNENERARDQHVGFRVVRVNDAASSKSSENDEPAESADSAWADSKKMTDSDTISNERNPKS